MKSAAGWGAFGSGVMGMLGRQATAQGGVDPPKLLFIFQRGGNDGINTVIPQGDPSYSPALRPSLYINPASGLGLDTTGFAQLHPGMSPLMEVYNGSAINGVPGMGNLALVHRVGYTRQSRSHFDSQDYWERGVPRDPSVKTGMFYRHLAASSDLSDPVNGFSAASISSNGLRALQGETPFPNFTSASQFDFLGSAEERLKFRGQPPSSEGAGDGKGMLGLYGGTQLGGRTPSGIVHSTGQALGTTLEALAGAQETYLPENGAVYPDGRFGRYLSEASMLFKRTDVRILGLNIGGHDTHTNQGAANGSQEGNLADLAEGIRALSLDLQDQWSNLLVVTMTEFGRTSKENGSNGTDHGEASVMFVAGGGVNGGVYNCDETSWEHADPSDPDPDESSAMFLRSGRYLSRKTDFRSVFAEVFTKHFGDSPERLETIIPGYAQAVADTPDEMAELGIL